MTNFDSVSMIGGRALVGLLLVLVSAANCQNSGFQDVQGSKFMSDLHNLTLLGLQISEPKFHEGDLGFDTHSDIFYYHDKLIESVSKRSMYMNTKLTLAGQATSWTGELVFKASYPFAIGQRCAIDMGYSGDRWDVKDDGEGVQMFGLYYGWNGKFVVNKLRAHLLRYLANKFQRFVPILERVAQPDAEDYPDAVKAIYEEVSEVIKQQFILIDNQTRSQMNDKDDGQALATVAIITKSHIITANVGTGPVYAYDSEDEVHLLTPDYVDVSKIHPFGAKKSRKPDEKLEPHINIYLRDIQDGSSIHTTPNLYSNEPHPEVDHRKTAERVEIQFLVMESPNTGAFFGPDEAIGKGLLKLKDSEPNMEQHVYSKIVEEIVDSAVKRLNFLQKFSHPDQMAALIGLGKQY